MSFGSTGTYLPWGTFGGTFWGGYWAPPPGFGISVSDTSTLGFLDAEPIDYSSMLLEWSEPNADFDTYVILRNQYGFPMSLNDGVVVTVGTQGDGANDFTDGGLGTGFYYYSMFVRIATATPQWIRVAQDVSFIAIDNASGEWMYELLPEWYRTEDAKTPGHPSDADFAAFGQLRRYMELLGRQYDNLRYEASSLMDLYRPRATRGDLIQHFSYMFGFPFEPHIGFGPTRRILANWFEILETKGTLPGIDTVVQSLTGYDTAVELGDNLVLTLCDGEGSGGSGQWRFDNTGRTQSASGSVTVTNVTPTSPYTATCTTAVKLTADGTHHAIVVDADLTSATTVKLTAIPVVASSVYDYQVALRAVEAFTNTPGLFVYWYTAAGVYISKSTVAGTLYNNAAWTISSGIVHSPSTAAYAVIGVDATPGGTNSTEITGVMFNLDSAATPAVPSYEAARQVNITMYPTRVNFFPNPNFDNAALHFTGTADYTVAQSSAQANPATGGTKSMKVTLGPAVTDATVLSDLVQVAGPIVVPSITEGDVWAWAFTIYPGQTPAGEIVCPVIKIFNVDTTTVVECEDVATGNIGLGWAQMIFETEIRDATLQLPKLQVGFKVQNAPAGAVYYIDSAQLERDSYLYQYSYFDGDSDPTVQDFSWSGAADNSPAMYFANKYLRNARLVALIEDYLPPVCAYSLTYALPTS